MPFKLHRASSNGGELAGTAAMNHQFCQVPSNCALHPQVNSIFRVDGKMGPTQRRFLLDSGAAVSVAHLDALDEKWQSQITAAGLKTTVGADGLPLEVAFPSKLYKLTALSVYIYI